jgi:hypothetical protein
MSSGDKAQHGGSIPIYAHDLEMVTSGSSPVALARDAIYAVDTAMRDSYDALRARVIEHLSPVIVVQSDLGGGTYTLVCDGTQTIERPVPALFQLVKSICHTPLGIYSIIAPYLTSSNTQEWKQPLVGLRGVLDNGLQHLSSAELPAKAEAASREILTRGIRFIDDSIAAAGFTIDSFEMFTSKAQRAIHTNMKFAAEAQISGVQALLRRWRGQLGPDQWRKLYAVVLAIWTTEVRNQNWLVLREMMDPTTVDRHLITLSTAAPAEDTVAVALDNLARIVQDNVAAAMIFPNSSKEDRAEATALAGPEDLLSDTIEKSLRACPHSARATPLTLTPDPNHFQIK